MPDRAEIHDRLHRQLLDQIDELLDADPDAWAAHLARLQAFHTYSPHNQRLLAAQGATPPVASYKAWQQITDVNGEPCQVARGASAMWVMAPRHRSRTATDPDTGEDTTRRVLSGFVPVPVFDHTQLVTPPHLAPPLLPERLTGEHTEPGWIDAVTAVINAHGFEVRSVAEIDGYSTANGITRFPSRSGDALVEIRDDLGADQTLKTLLHEAAHIVLHDPRTAPPVNSSVAEIEAESVAYTLAASLGLDTSAYSLAYVAGWAHGDRDLIASTTTRVLGAVVQLTNNLETHLGTELHPTLSPLGSAARTVAVETPTPGAEPDMDRVDQRVAELGLPAVGDTAAVDRWWAWAASTPERSRDSPEL